MKRKYDIVIGIDPDVEQSGVARLDIEQKTLWAQTLPFPLLIDYIRDIFALSLSGRHIGVVIEASWLNSHNWHLSRFDNLAIAARKGYDEGRNHEAGRKVVEMLQHYGIEVGERAPLRKIWQGKDRKITHAEITAITGWDKKRSNQEERDAALIAWSESGLPIIVKRVCQQK